MNTAFPVFFISARLLVVMRFVLTALLIVLPALSFAADQITLIRSNAVFTMNADGTGLTQLTTPTGGDFDSGLVRYSPNGAKIAFQRFVNYNAELWVMNVNGTGAMKISATANPNAYSETYGWSPDSSKLAFIADARLWLANTDGSNPVQVVAAPNTAWAPSFAPNGAKIAYAGTANGSGRSQIWAVNTDGTGLTNLTN